MKKTIIFTISVVLFFSWTIYYTATFYLLVRETQEVIYADLLKNIATQQEFVYKTLKDLEDESVQLAKITDREELKGRIAKNPDIYNAKSSDLVVSIVVLDSKKQFLYGWGANFDEEINPIETPSLPSVIKDRYWASIDLNAFFHASRAVYVIQRDDLSYLVITYSLNTALGHIESLSFGYQSYGYVKRLEKGDTVSSVLPATPSVISRFKNSPIYLAVPILDDWILVFTGIWMDLFPATTHDIHSIFYIIIFWGISATGITALIFRARISRPKALWATSFVFDFFSCLFIVFFFLGFGETTRQINQRTETYRNLQKLWERADHTVTYIPTVIHLESLTFPDDDSFVVTGFISQIYPKNKPMEMGFVFPYQGLIYPPVITEISRIDDGQSITILWQFGVQITDSFSPEFFPFDKRHVDITIWPKEVHKNVVLFPDFLNFRKFQRSETPGIGVHLDTLGWRIMNSSYLLQNREAYYFFGATSLPVIFQFTIDLRRDFLGAFLSNALALMLCVVVAFLVLFIPRDSLLDSLFATISIFVGLIFIAVTNHASLRDALQVASFAYCEYFFISFYILLLAITLDFIFTIGKPAESNNKRLILAICYWPILLGSFTIILAIAAL